VSVSSPAFKCDVLRVKTSAMVRVASGWTSSKVKFRVSQRLPRRLITTLLYCTALQFHQQALDDEIELERERET
jgi:hypothetical protein